MCGRPPVCTGDALLPILLPVLAHCHYSTRALQPGEQSALLSAIFEWQDRLIPQRDMGPPCNDQASTPIKPASRPRGHSAQRVRRMKVGRAPRRGTGGGGWKDPRNKVGFRARSREGRRQRMKPGMEAPGGAATGGVATRNGAKTGHGSSCNEAAIEAKEDPVP